MIVVYYGVNLLSSRRSISRSAFLSLCPLFIFPIPPASSSGLSISPRSTCSSFSLPRSFPASLPLNLTICLASAGLFMSSAYAPIFIPLRCLSLSFCILNCPYPASFPFLALRSIPPGLLLYLIFHFLPATQSRPASPRPSFSFSFSFSSGLYFCAPDILPVANIVFLPPPP